MRKVVALITFLFVSYSGHTQEKANELLTCLKAEEFIEGYYASYLANIIKNSPDILAGWNLDSSNKKDSLEFVETFQEGFETYKSMVSQQTFSHYYNSDDTIVAQFLKLCSEMELDDLREATGFYDLMEAQLELVKGYIDHDSQFLYEKLMANHVPLRLVVRVEGDSISSKSQIDLSMKIITKDSGNAIDILPGDSLVVKLPENLGYENIHYLTLTYQGQLYEFGKPMFNDSNMPDPSKLALLQNSLNMFPKDVFENKLFWYLTVADGAISLKTNRQESLELKK